MQCNDRWIPADVASMIDYTELRIDARYGDLELACLQAVKYGFASVALHPIHVARCVKLLSGSGVKVDAVVGFHTGGFTIENKVFEARDAIHDGAAEIDFVIHVAALKAGDVGHVRREMDAMREATKGCVIKAVLETCLLSNEETVTACRCATEAGLDFVQTSTGFSTHGAMVEDVRRMKTAVGSSGVAVKASGGIRTVSEVLDMVEAGASRLGTTASVRDRSQDGERSIGEG